MYGLALLAQTVSWSVPQAAHSSQTSNREDPSFKSGTSRKTLGAFRVLYVVITLGLYNKIDLLLDGSVARERFCHGKAPLVRV